jgi:hypothetical protein
LREFEFTLKFSLPDPGVDSAEYIESLGSAGCDDALIGIGQHGCVALSFTREANSAFEAIASARAAVMRAIPGAELVEATPDLVGLTDLADIVGCSRQYMRKLMILSGASFPPPLYGGKPALWRLSNLLGWLKDSKRYQVEETLMDVARANMQLNIAREANEIGLDLTPFISSN